MENLSPLYAKQETCPLCEQKFSSMKLRNRFAKVVGQDTDLKPNYEDPTLNPSLYNVKVCPQCGYSFTDDFSKYFAPGTKNILKEKITDNWVSQDYGQSRTVHEAINSYKLAFYSGFLKKEKHLTLAGLALRIAWFYRDLAAREEEQRFLAVAAEQYEQAYLNEDLTLTPMSDVKVMYLLAELHVRLGHGNEAVKYFSKVLEKQRGSREKHIIEMARDRWYELRDEMKKSEASAV
ncbi:DUF2225 domain-containing protein [Pseudobacillus wudalianchiensis]|uniref:Uncharacterized protein n=1 Tax=Pseudobacillus wudalianchiensis TaxID=1743143 RepID=A0A1B9AC08_9BACI|nr:DUF2225 domain-containing protein [Bacillus wudalianchiensis]OCA81376.1 hypothetical protein A8F95_16615 [Bacillus wudalianchiensis]